MNAEDDDETPPLDKGKRRAEGPPPGAPSPHRPRLEEYWQPGDFESEGMFDAFISAAEEAWSNEKAWIHRQLGAASDPSGDPSNPVTNDQWNLSSAEKDLVEGFLKWRLDCGHLSLADLIQQHDDYFYAFVQLTEELKSFPYGNDEEYPTLRRFLMRLMDTTGIDICQRIIGRDKETILENIVAHAVEGERPQTTKSRKSRFGTLQRNAEIYAGALANAGRPSLYEVVEAIETSDDARRERNATTDRIVFLRGAMAGKKVGKAEFNEKHLTNAMFHFFNK